MKTKKAVDLESLKATYLKAKKAYYNANPIMTDAEFDSIEDTIKKLDPKWSELKKTGVKVKDKKTEVDLLAFMPSLNKIYPEKAPAWIAKQTWAVMHIMAKLDGSSIQLVAEGGKITRMITRGDGVRGGDISFLISHVNLPKKIPIKSQVIFRVEAVMSRDNFKRWAKDFDNPRNMVSGLLNRREPHPALADIDFVVLAVMGTTIEIGLQRADSWGFKTVDRRKCYTNKLDLPALLTRMRTSSPCDIDGIVLVPAEKVINYTDADKPKWAVAYKENVSAEDAVTATVEDIIYQVSASGRIIPKVKLTPVKVGDVTVTYATLHNAQWMMDRKIGPKAQIKIVRSGDVIPKVIDVVKPSAIKYPSVNYEKRGVHFVAVGANKESSIQKILRFFEKLGIEFIKEGTVKELYLNGYKTSYDYMNLAKYGRAELLVQAGMGKVMAKKVFEELQRVLCEPIDLKTLMVASGTFDPGMGSRKLAVVDKHLGFGYTQRLVSEIISASKGKSVEQVIIKPFGAVRDHLLTVPGYSDKTAELYIKGVTDFIPWFRKASDFISLSQPVRAVAKKRPSGVLSGQRVSFTGYRSPEHEAAVEAAGGEVITFGAKTTILVYKAGGKASSKVDKASKAGARVITFDELGI